MSPVRAICWGQLPGLLSSALGCAGRPCQTGGMAIFSLHHASIGRSTHPAGTAAAHARYITRYSAAGVVMCSRSQSSAGLRAIIAGFLLTLTDSIRPSLLTLFATMRAIMKPCLQSSGGLLTLIATEDGIANRLRWMAFVLTG